MTAQQELAVPTATSSTGGPLLDIFVAGTPAPQGSKKAHAIYKGRGENREFTGKVSVSESSKKVKPWRADVRQAAVEAWSCPRSLGDAGAEAGACCSGLLGETPHLRPPLDEALALRVEFVLYRPVATPKRTTPPATKYPDVSKLTRSTEDALTQAGVLRDDARIVDEWPSKRLAEIGERTGARIQIWPAGARPWDVPPEPAPATLLLPDVILVFAFRYALGRMSPGVGTVADELMHQAPRLEQWQREQIVRDIDQAIAAGRAGMDCDAEVWRGVRNLLAEINQRAPEVSRG